MIKAASVLLTVFLCAAVAAVTTPTAVPLTSIPPATNTPSPTTTILPSPAPPRLAPFGVVNINKDEIEFDLDGDGRNVDSIAFWEAPDPTASLMFVTSKGNESIEVYQYPFQEQLRTLSCGEASNGVWVEQASAILYVTGRESNQVCAYTLPDLSLDSAHSFKTAATRDWSEPNLALLTLPDGRKRIYVSYDEVVYYHDAENGNSLGSFKPEKGLETMFADDYYQALYIPDEGDRSGVYIYDKDGNRAGQTFGDRSIFDSDAEGIWVYKCFSREGSDNGEGLIVISDQKEDQTDFEFFQRSSKAHLGTLTIDGVNNTDGIAITQQASPAYPMGLLAVIDDDDSTVGVGWETIFEITGLSCGG